MASLLLGAEGVELVPDDDEVREGVDPEGGVVVPVHGAGVQGEGGEVALYCTTNFFYYRGSWLQ